MRFESAQKGVYGCGAAQGGACWFVSYCLAAPPLLCDAGAETLQEEPALGLGSITPNVPFSTKINTRVQFEAILGNEQRKHWQKKLIFLP